MLVDRRGNGLDRALLLAELLRLAGHEATVMRGRLERPAAEELLLGTESDRLRPEAPVEPWLDRLRERLAEGDPAVALLAESEAAMQAAREDLDEQVATIAHDAGQEAARLLGLLRRTGMPE